MNGVEETVASLINSDTGQWNIDRVTTMFPPSAASQTLKLIIPSISRKDRLSGSMKNLANTPSGVRIDCAEVRKKRDVWVRRAKNQQIK